MFIDNNKDFDVLQYIFVLTKIYKPSVTKELNQFLSNLNSGGIANLELNLNCRYNFYRWKILSKYFMLKNRFSFDGKMFLSKLIFHIVRLLIKIAYLSGFKKVNHLMTLPENKEESK